MDIDCRRYNYDTQVNPIIKAAAEKAREANSVVKPTVINKIQNTREAALENIFQWAELHRQLSNPTTTVEVKDTTFSTASVQNKTDSKRTETIGESLQKSMLKYIDKHNLDKEVLEEAFCRDIDSYNSVFVVMKYSNHIENL